MSRRKKFANSGLTLIEMLVVVAIIGLIAAILLPVFASVREKGRRTTCLSNLRQIAVALTAYTQDNEGTYPPGGKDQNDWAGAILSYARAKDVFRCPDAQVPPTVGLEVPGLPSEFDAKGYAIDSNLAGVSVRHALAGSTNAYVRFPSTTISVGEFAYRQETATTGESFSWPAAITAPDDGSNLHSGESLVGPAGALRHGGGSNYAFVDGHVHWYTPPQVLNSNKPNDGSQPSFVL